MLVKADALTREGKGESGSNVTTSTPAIGSTSALIENAHTNG